MILTPLQQHTLNQHWSALASYLPGGDLFRSKTSGETTLGGLFLGLSRELQRSDEYLKSLQDEFIPDITNNLIPDWERVLGIPDDCFTGIGTNDKRRRDILVKLASLGIQTVQDFEDLALIFGVTITCIPGIDWVGGGGYPFGPIASEHDARFTIVIQFSGGNFPVFPLTFPIQFGTSTEGLLSCLFNKLKPANCQVIFDEV